VEDREQRRVEAKIRGLRTSSPSTIQSPECRRPARVSDALAWGLRRSEAESGGRGLAVPRPYAPGWVAGHDRAWPRSAGDGRTEMSAGFISGPYKCLESRLYQERPRFAKGYLASASCSRNLMLTTLQISIPRRTHLGFSLFPRRQDFVKRHARSMGYDRFV
jgi:hypothetical protein